MVTAGSHLLRAALFTATTDEASPGIKSYFFFPQNVDEAIMICL